MDTTLIEVGHKRLVHEYARSTVLQSTINCRPCTNFKLKKSDFSNLFGRLFSFTVNRDPHCIADRDAVRYSTALWMPDNTIETHRFF